MTVETLQRTLGKFQQDLVCKSRFNFQTSSRNIRICQSKPKVQSKERSEITLNKKNYISTIVEICLLALASWTQPVAAQKNSAGLVAKNESSQFFIPDSDMNWWGKVWAIRRMWIDLADWPGFKFDFLHLGLSHFKHQSQCDAKTTYFCNV